MINYDFDPLYRKQRLEIERLQAENEDLNLMYKEQVDGRIINNLEAAKIEQNLSIAVEALDKLDKLEHNFPQLSQSDLIELIDQIVDEALRQIKGE